MRRISKVLVIAMTFIMVMALNITAFAETIEDVDGPAVITEGTAKIEISGLTQTTTIKYKQILENSPTGGWQIVDDTAIKAIFDTFKTDTITDPIKGYKEASESDRADAFENVECTETAGVNGNTITVSKAGLYLIQASDSSNEYTYKKMIAYVGYEYDDNGNAKLKDAEKINAKKAKTTVDKNAADVFIDQFKEIEYTVEAVIPFVPVGAVPAEGSDYLVTINDVVTNGHYIATDNKVSVTYKLAGEEGTNPIVVPVTVINGNSQSIIIPLDQFIKNSDGIITNENVDKKILLTYKVKADGPVVDNKATPIIWGKEKTPSEEKVVSAKLQVTKFNMQEKPIAGARFIIFRVRDEVTEYAVMDETTKTLKEWTTDETEATSIETDSNGIAEFNGFDRDFDYTAREVAAPGGYSIAEEPTVALTWQTNKYDNNGEIIEDQLATGSVFDDELIILPNTGGSGTALFTATGVILMSVAAGIYFANKRKMSK